MAELIQGEVYVSGEGTGRQQTIKVDEEGFIIISNPGSGGGGGGGAVTIANGADVNAGATTDTPLKNGWDTAPGTGSGTQTDAASQGTISRKLGGLHLLLSKAYNQVRDAFRVTADDSRIVTLGAIADSAQADSTQSATAIAALKGVNANLRSGATKAVIRSGVKGTATASDVTSADLSVNVQALDVNIRDSSGAIVSTFGNADSTAALQTAGNLSLSNLDTDLGSTTSAKVVGDVNGDVIAHLRQLNYIQSDVHDDANNALRVVNNLIPNYQDDLRSRAVVEHRFNRYTVNATGQLISQSGVLHTAWVIFLGTPVAGTITLYDNVSGTGSTDALARFDILTTSTGTMALPIPLDIWCDAGVRAEYSVANTNARLEIAFR
jgi:hypothetical protein